MSEARRGRRPRINQNKGNENELNGKGVVILAKKEPREKPKDDERLDSQDEGHRREDTTSPFLLRNNRLRMVVQKPPTIQTKSVAVKAVENALRTGSEERERPASLRHVDKSEMTQRAKFLNKFGELEDDFLQYLTEDASFKVIGVIGLQSSGKSHIMNTLAGRTVFPVEKIDDAEQCRHRTVGVDAFVTSDRTILLDMQPLLALSTMDNFIQSEKRTPSGAIDYHQSLESQVMIESLQTACFLLSICHTVVVTFDWFLDRDLAQFLQSAEMLKPTTPKTTTTNMLDDEISDYFPHVVFVKNRSDFISLKDNRTMASELGRVFKDSMLLFRDGVTNGLGKAVPEEAVNIFQMPLKTDPLYDTVCRDLLSKVLSMPQEEFVVNPPRAFSERQWFQHSVKIWDTIKKSSMFQEYKRLLV